LLEKRSEEEVKELKMELSEKTLVGEYCNMENMQHLVNYGQEAQLFFYALIDKNNRKEDCLPLSSTFKFLERHQLPRVKCETIEAKSIDDTYERLREVVVKLNEMTMKEGGEGSVLYVAGVDSEG
jgi:ATP-dependent RNA circularization protein (DNA/RNA ligase family)